MTTQLPTEIPADVPTAMQLYFPAHLPAGGYMSRPAEAETPPAEGEFGFTVNGQYYLCGLAVPPLQGLWLGQGVGPAIPAAAGAVHGK